MEDAISMVAFEHPVWDSAELIRSSQARTGDYQTMSADVLEELSCLRSGAPVSGERVA